MTSNRQVQCILRFLNNQVHYTNKITGLMYVYLCKYAFLPFIYIKPHALGGYTSSYQNTER
jgi:hypothetical protein